MKNIVLLIFILGIVVVVASSQEEDSLSSLFPVMEGWIQDGAPDTYTPATLYEYINGAAEVYLSYGFRELATVTYEKDQDRSLTIEVYRHNSLNNGFGIYSQEKPLKSTFLTVGAQGYYEPGMLNFFKDKYYVKVLSFGLGEEGSSILKSAAGQIAGKIPGETFLPKPLACFPDTGKVENSERYIARNFLGHSFLHSAFVAEYNMEGENIRPFILELDNDEETATMLKAYLELLEKNGIEYEKMKNEYRFQDPYFDKTKTMHLKRKNRYIWGLFTGDPSIAAFYLNAIEGRLKEYKLIQ